MATFIAVTSDIRTARENQGETDHSRHPGELLRPLLNSSILYSILMFEESREKGGGVLYLHQ